MKHSVLIAAIILAQLAIAPNARATYPDWPDTTLISWEAKDDLICYETLVWCLLESSTDSSDFDSLMQSRTDAAEEILKKPSIWVKELTFDGQISKPEIPAEFALGPIYPNPFNSTTIVNYSLASSEDLLIRLFDISGRELRTLHNGFSPAGLHRIVLDGTQLPSGTYLLRMDAGKFKATIKTEVLR